MGLEHRPQRRMEKTVERMIISPPEVGVPFLEKASMEAKSPEVSRKRLT